MNKLKNKILLRNIQNINNYFNTCFNTCFDTCFAFLLNLGKINDHFNGHEYKYSKID